MDGKMGRRFNQEQYDMLKRCSDKKDMTEWNEWREGHKDLVILLEGANLSGMYLQGANLGITLVQEEEYVAHGFDIEKRGEVHLERVRLDGTQMKRCYLKGACLDGAVLRDACLYEAELSHANLNGADLVGANLMRTKLDHASFRGADFSSADLRGVMGANVDLADAVIRCACMEDAKFYWANLSGAEISHLDMRKTIFRGACVSGGTIITAVAVDRETDFSLVGLGDAIIDVEARQLLECNIRRKNWGDWYEKHRILRWPVRLFWAMSDYGISTWRVIVTFFLLAIVFA